MKKVVRFIIKFVNKATADSVPAYAAQVAFFVMLSFFPFMMLLVMIVSKLSVMNTNVLGYILRVVPSGLESYVAYSQCKCAVVYTHYGICQLVVCSKGHSGTLDRVK